MGKMLGAFDNREELDRPDLNKCPDCECFFAGDSCPLCGKICPEEMRAGNRKPPKKVKCRRTSRRTVFINWYHRWWFIILMMFVMPVAGIILLITSPHSKRSKIIFVIICALYTLISSIGIGTIVGGIINIFDPPVNTMLSREEYIAKCENVTPEEIWKAPDVYKGQYVILDVQISKVIYFSEVSNFGNKYTMYNSDYYQCELDGVDGYILIRSYIKSGRSIFSVGDKLTVYGEYDDISVIHDHEGNIYDAPCVNVAYATIQY